MTWETPWFARFSLPPPPLCLSPLTVLPSIVADDQPLRRQPSSQRLRATSGAALRKVWTRRIGASRATAPAGTLPLHPADERTVHHFQVKIMYPRLDDPRSNADASELGVRRVGIRAGLSGFVAYMKRTDAEQAIKDFDGLDWGGSILKVGWSKAVPIPRMPIFGQSPSRRAPERVLPPKVLLTSHPHSSFSSRHHLRHPPVSFSFLLTSALFQTEPPVTITRPWTVFVQGQPSTVLLSLPFSLPVLLSIPLAVASASQERAKSATGGRKVHSNRRRQSPRSRRRL